MDTRITEIAAGTLQVPQHQPATSRPVITTPPQSTACMTGLKQIPKRVFDLLLCRKPKADAPVQQGGGTDNETSGATSIAPGTDSLVITLPSTTVSVMDDFADDILSTAIMSVPSVHPNAAGNGNVSNSQMPTATRKDSGEVVALYDQNKGTSTQDMLILRKTSLQALPSTSTKQSIAPSHARSKQAEADGDAEIMHALNNAYVTINQALDRQDNSLNRLGGSLNRLGGSLNRLDSSLNRLDSSLNRLENSRSEIGGSLDKLENTLDDSHKRMEENLVFIKEKRAERSETPVVLDDATKAFLQRSEDRDAKLTAARDKFKLTKNKIIAPSTSEESTSSKNVDSTDKPSESQ
jgi:hypothetical protein